MVQICHLCIQPEARGLQLKLHVCPWVRYHLTYSSVLLIYRSASYILVKLDSFLDSKPDAMKTPRILGITPNCTNIEEHKTIIKICHRKCKLFFLIPPTHSTHEKFNVEIQTFSGSGKSKKKAIFIKFS